MRAYESAFCLYVYVYYSTYKHANADGTFSETPNKKLAFTLAPRGRVLIRITRVCLLCGRVLSVARPFHKVVERAKEGGGRVETHRKGS